ncbi:helix-turn-helix domain-containing protein [Acidovorax sp. 1608163]|uniref:helix-turn-helix domain-containing protein n=1 Tax=Acidovorax sp. 1608163 TaxID=2478662 RepID=UPI0013CE450D|nr:helix-turn-helix domain-containing protein [Acidovorax sp. 1608163]
MDTAKTTQSAIELRRALAVMLPILHELSISETASVLGRSETWVVKERQGFIRESSSAIQDSSKGGRRNQLIPADQEDAFMESVWTSPGSIDTYQGRN